ncbi:nucleotide-binding universal stress UspA family protein [Clavibacter michiganensis]|uniref:universal stress protein n=1 Tax=Clavibacter michiganensis TaxID=28447 RepID=UPI001AE3F4C6|nr:universal stress protein [Clavibacter michiganensis]MBP2459084.1 nucleotide-binding universal stress UspA family protein [Clavibacter michiganensis]MDQ0411656.1 nucleotide-binding universal stress UspA family protein [Clavibacter michiganensis]
MTARTDAEGMRLADPPARSAARCAVGYDGSAASATALAWAVARAVRSGGGVLLVGVVDDDSGGMGAAYAQQSAHDLGVLLSAAAARVASGHPGLAVTTRLVTGPVAPALAAAVRADDVLVVGSDKTGYARGRLYGVRSVQLASLVPGPLVVVPSADLRLRDGVVVALDGTPRSDALARAGAEEASAAGCRVGLVHAVPQDGGADARHAGDAVLRRGLDVAHEVDPGLEVTRHLTSRRPAEAILNLSRDRALLVIGRSRRTPAPGIGGTLHEVLLNANAPVMILPGTPTPTTDPRTIETEEA